MLQPYVGTVPAHDVPDKIFTNAVAPNCFILADGAEHSPAVYLGRGGPAVQLLFGPMWSRNGSNMAALTDQVNNDPMSLTDLDLLDLAGSPVQLDEGRIQAGLPTWHSLVAAAGRRRTRSSLDRSSVPGLTSCPNDDQAAWHPLLAESRQPDQHSTVCNPTLRTPTVGHPLAFG